MNILEILNKAVEQNVADIFIVAGIPVRFKIHGKQENLSDERMMPDSIQVMIDEIYDLSKRDRRNLNAGLDDDFSFAVPHTQNHKSFSSKSR